MIFYFPLMPPRPPSLPPSSFFVNLKSSLSIPSSYLDNNHLFLKLIPRKSTLGISRAKMWQTVRLFRVGGCPLARLKIRFYGENIQTTNKQADRQKRWRDYCCLAHLQEGLGSLILVSTGHLLGIHGGLPFPRGFDVWPDHVSCFGW